MKWSNVLLALALGAVSTEAWAPSMGGRSARLVRSAGRPSVHALAATETEAGEAEAAQAKEMQQRVAAGVVASMASSIVFASAAGAADVTAMGAYEGAGMQASPMLMAEIDLKGGAG